MNSIVSIAMLNGSASSLTESTEEVSSRITNSSFTETYTVLQVLQGCPDKEVFSYQNSPSCRLTEDFPW